MSQSGLVHRCNVIHNEHLWWTKSGKGVFMSVNVFIVKEIEVFEFADETILSANREKYV
jgi:hypothetical protein